MIACSTELVALWYPIIRDASHDVLGIEIKGKGKTKLKYKPVILITSRS